MASGLAAGQAVSVGVASGVLLSTGATTRMGTHRNGSPVFGSTRFIKPFDCESDGGSAAADWPRNEKSGNALLLMATGTGNFLCLPCRAASHMYTRRIEDVLLRKSNDGYMFSKTAVDVRES